MAFRCVKVKILIITSLLAIVLIQLVLENTHLKQFPKKSTDETLFVEDESNQPPMIDLSLTSVNTSDWGNLFYKVNFTYEVENAILGNPFQPLPNFRNPCWRSRMRITDSQQNMNEIGLNTELLNIYTASMARVSAEQKHSGTSWRLRCFPDVMLIGVSKSGTTDLFDRIIMHPHIFPSIIKEPMFWNRRRMLQTPSDSSIGFEQYADLFDTAADELQKVNQTTDSGIYYPGLAIEGTPQYLTHFDGWEKVPGNSGLSEPKYTLPHTLHALRPGLKFIVILRNPADRLYSSYKMVHQNHSAEQFKVCVDDALQLWAGCLQNCTLRACAYKNSIYWRMETKSDCNLLLRNGLYSTFLRDWFKVFPRRQFQIVKAENYYKDMEIEVNNVYTFLGLRTLHVNESILVSPDGMRIKNVRSSEPMLAETRDILDQFYGPHNADLSELLNDIQYAWA